MHAHRIAVSLILASFAVLSSACVTNPETGSSGFNIMPDSVMNNLGAQAFNDVIQQSPISRDRRMTEIVTRVATRIAQQTNEDFDWQVRLVDNQQANAFVLPGGKIVVYTGILPICENEAGLAFVMGHEVGHAVARHGSQRMSQNVGLQVALGVADASLGNSQSKGVIMGALGAGAQYGVLLPFSRGHESDADHTGIRYMARAGYDPSVAPSFWQRMARQSGGEQPPEWSSTHPSHDTRTARLNELLPEAIELYEKAPVKYGLGEDLTTSRSSGRRFRR